MRGDSSLWLTFITLFHPSESPPYLVLVLFGTAFALLQGKKRRNGEGTAFDSWV
jgi:hypothetical protein